jgi:hypothetical protein
MTRIKKKARREGIRDGAGCKRRWGWETDRTPGVECSAMVGRSHKPFEAHLKTPILNGLDFPPERSRSQIGQRRS